MLQVILRFHSQQVRSDYCFLRGHRWCALFTHKQNVAKKPTAFCSSGVLRAINNQLQNFFFRKRQCPPIWRRMKFQLELVYQIILFLKSRQGCGNRLFPGAIFIYLGSAEFISHPALCLLLQLFFILVSWHFNQGKSQLF